METPTSLQDHLASDGSRARISPLGEVTAESSGEKRKSRDVVRSRSKAVVKNRIRRRKKGKPPVRVKGDAACGRHAFVCGSESASSLAYIFLSIGLADSVSTFPDAVCFQECATCRNSISCMLSISIFS